MSLHPCPRPIEPLNHLRSGHVAATAHGLAREPRVALPILLVNPGKLRKLAGRFYALCQSHEPQYNSSIMTWVRNFMHRATGRPGPAPPEHSFEDKLRQIRGDGTHVYFIRDTVTGEIKIGQSRDVERRFKGIETGNTHIELMGFVFASAWLESVLHEELHADRTKGEWFAPTPHVLATIDRVMREPRFKGPLTSQESPIADFVRRARGK